MNRFDNQRGTAPIVDSIKNEKPNICYSKFDLSSQIAFDAHIGWVIPFDLIETLPDSDYSINYDIVAITRNPLVRRLLSGMSVYIHTYGEDLKDLWEGFPRFITRGRSGTADLRIPQTTNFVQTGTSEDSDVFLSTAFSPSSYLGIPPKVISFDDQDIISNFSNNLLRYFNVSYYDWDSTPDKIVNPTINFNALPLVMYQQICIHNYLPSNLVQGNKNFYPDNELHLILADDASGQIIYSLNYSTIRAKEKPSYEKLVDVAISNNDTPVYLDSMRVRQFRGDEFTTGLPFPDLVRGDIPTAQITNTSTLSFTIPGSTHDVIPDGNFAAADGTDYTFRLNVPSDVTHTEYFPGGLHNYSDTVYPKINYEIDYGEISEGVTKTGLKSGDYKLQVAIPSKTVSDTVSFNSAITMSQLRSLAVLTKFREIMARTDGSYNDMIKAQFGSSPKLHNHKPFYIGGIKQDLIFSEVVQTSESSSNTPLGTTASRGITAGSGYVGKYHSKDYGYIMSVLSIVPDIFYHQGLDKKWSRINQSDFYFPINNNLSPEGLLNKRLYVSGTSATDDGLFAYQERDSDYKSRRNRVAGRLIYTSAQSEEDNAYVMKRTFSTTPTLSYGFTGMFPSNIDMSIFASANDTPFIFNIASRITAVQPMPYTTTPSDLGIIS